MQTKKHFLQIINVLAICTVNFPANKKKSALPVSGGADALMLKQFCRAYVRHSGKMAAGTFAWAKVRKKVKC